MMNIFMYHTPAYVVRPRKIDIVKAPDKHIALSVVGIIDGRR